VVEEAAVIILYKPFQELPRHIKTIVYNWGDLTKQAPCSALVLGFGSLYNHDNPAAMSYKADTDKMVLRYTAERDIQKGEELTVNYNSGGGSHLSENDDWFERNQITLLEE